MRTIIFAALGFVAFTFAASANSVILIDIKTTPTAVAYSINNQPFAPAQLAEWMKNAIEQFGDKEPILIQPDSQTTFATVFTLLESLKASGVKHFEIIAERSDSPASITIRSLTATAEQVKRDQIQKLPPPK